MATRSPRERLHKLFHKHEARDTRKEEAANTPSPPASPSATGQQKHVRKTSSRLSLRDMVHTKGRRSRPASMNVEDMAPPDTQAAAQAAATKAMFPDQRNRLPSVAHTTDLSDDLRHMTLADSGRAAGRRPYSEDIADRNIVKRKPIGTNAIPSGSERARGSYPPNVQQLVPNTPRHSEDVANWNIVRNESPTDSSWRDLPQPLKVKKRASVSGRAESPESPISPVNSNESRSLSHKSDYGNLRQSSDATRPRSPAVPPRNAKTSLDSDRHRIKRSSLEKPLPPRPSDEFAAELENDPVIRHHLGLNALPDGYPEHGHRLADKGIDLTGIVDLSNTEDTTLYERWAPAVTHETIRQDVHEIRHEEITREIHEHEVFHRVLPVVDIEVLPSRHFVPVEGGYAEISESEVPGRAGANAQWVIAETVSKMLPESKGSVVPERFSARKFEDADGDSKDYMTPEGFRRTEQWWVHPPTFYEPGAVASGQTYPFFIGSPDPEQSGLRASLPGGNVIGVSPLLAKQRREQAAGTNDHSQQPSESAPPVPPHKIFPADLVDAARARKI